MLSLAEFELERIRANWADARERAVGRGIHLAAIPPFGYLRGNDGRLIPDPTTGPIVGELFERRAAGVGWADLGRWLESVGAKTQRGRDTWALRAMRDVVRNDVYLGVASHGEFRQEGAHDALTDEVTWRRAQRQGRQTISRASEPALFTGLLRCAGCRYVMRAATRTLADGRVVHDYRCRCGADVAGRCLDMATATGTAGIESFVIDAFFTRIEDYRAGAAADDGRLRELDAAAGAARVARDDYAADSRVQAAVGMDAYVAGLEARQAAYEAAQAGANAERDAADSFPIDQDTGSLRASWPTLTVDERRRLLGSVIDCVFVRRRVGTEPLDARTYVCWRGDAPADLPHKGVRVYSPKPFVFADPTDTRMALAQDGEPGRAERVA